MTDADFKQKLISIGWQKLAERYAGSLWISGAKNGYIETEITASARTLHKARLAVIRRIKEREKCRSV